MCPLMEYPANTSTILAMDTKVSTPLSPGVISRKDSLDKNCDTLDSDDSGISVKLNKVHLSHDDSLSISDDLSLEDSDTRNVIEAELESIGDFIAGIESMVKIRLHGDVNLPQKLTITWECDDLHRSHQEVAIINGCIETSWRPTHSGKWNLSLSTECWNNTMFTPDCFCMDVGGNNPICAFNEAEFWPVASAVDNKRCFLYVAYSQHISKFTLDGNFIDGLMDLQNGFYYDLVLCQKGQILVASVTGFITEDKKSVNRFQEVHIYDIQRRAVRLQHVVGRESPHGRFSNPVLPIAVKDTGTFLVADLHSIYEISAITGTTVDKISIQNLGSVSRVAYADKKFFIADAAIGQVKVFNQLGELLHCIEYKSNHIPHPIKGLVGLAVDPNLNIVIADCISGGFVILDINGEVVSHLESDWQALRWPVHVSLDQWKHLYVCDHGNLCIKKYKYS